MQDIVGEKEGLTFACFLYVPVTKNIFWPV